METQDVTYNIDAFVERAVNVDIHVEVEKVNEVPVYKDTVEDVKRLC